MVRGSPNPRHVGIAARLRKARRTAKFTRTGLDQKVGGTKGAILYIESGKRLPTVATVARIADALAVSAAWLAFGLGDMTTDGPIATTDGMGSRLRDVREERALTKAALARLVGLSPSTVADIENGAQTGVEVVALLALTLRINPAWLAFNDGPQVLPARRRGRPAAQSPADAR
jgi:transcriptional regulator with XRE-family HTH domain